MVRIFNVAKGWVVVNVQVGVSKNQKSCKSSGYPVKVRLSSFGPVIVWEIWKCDGILIIFQGRLNFFSSPYVTCFLESKATSLFHLP